MMGCKKILIVIALLILLSHWTSAEVLQINDTFTYLQSKTIRLEARQYTITPVYCDYYNPSVKFRINEGSVANLYEGKITGKLRVDDTYNLDNDYFLKMESMSYRYGVGFEDCNVQLSIFSYNNICGDGICSANENCQADNCCEGETFNLQEDVNHCGKCVRQCEKDQYCQNGYCISPPTCGDGRCNFWEEGKCRQDCQWCGDGNCNADETYNVCPNDCEKPPICGDAVCVENENCCLDCGCPENYYCLQNFCVPRLKCTANSDCDVNETCIDQKCVQKSFSKEELSNNLTFNALPKLVNKSTILEEDTETVTNTAQESESIFEIIKKWLLNLLFIK